MILETIRAPTTHQLELLLKNYPIKKWKLINIIKGDRLYSAFVVRRI